MVKTKKKTGFRKFKPLADVEKALAKAMRNLPHASFAKARIVERGVRDTTRTGYLNAAERADEICKEAGIEEGMRSKEGFTNYLWAKLDTGLARGNSTATYLRSALAFREKVEGRHAWPDDDDVRELVRCYNYAAKKILNLAVQRARASQKADGDRLFNMPLAQYRKEVAGARRVEWRWKGWRLFRTRCGTGASSTGERRTRRPSA
jgi:hypothetical protein